MSGIHEKAAVSRENVPCFECPGTLEEVIEDYETELPVVGKVVVEDVPMLRCPDCGDMVIGERGNVWIDACLDGIRRRRGLPPAGSGRQSFGRTDEAAGI
jgi:YgiT-type zinc finger domain-containing protein